MATCVTFGAHRNVRRVRAGINIDPSDYFDYTNKRPKSGIFKVSVTAVTWTNGVNGEKYTTTLGPPGYDEACNTRSVYITNGSANDASISTYTHATAWNYGVPDASARRNTDGSICLVEVVFELPPDPLVTAVLETAPAIVTVTYTVAFTDIDPYSAIGSSTERSLTLTLEPTAMVDTAEVTDTQSDDCGYVVLQLVDLETCIDMKGHCACTDRGCVCTLPPPNIRILTGARNHTEYAGAVSPECGTTKTFYWRYTHVFAVNDSKFDNSAARLVRSEDVSHSVRYALLYASLERTSGDPGPLGIEGTAALTYSYKHASV